MEQFEVMRSASSNVAEKTTESLRAGGNLATETLRATGDFAKRSTDKAIPEFLKGHSKQGDNEESTGMLGTVKKSAESLVPELLKGKSKEAEAEAEETDIEQGEGAKSAVVTAADPETKKKYQVMLDMLGEMFKANPGYELYVCGHSLGGALATMFSFEAAAASDELIPKPVTCVTTGAPKVSTTN